MASRHTDSKTKQGHLPFRQHGGARKGAGRKPNGERAGTGQSHRDPKRRAVEGGDRATLGLERSALVERPDLDLEVLDARLDAHREKEHVLFAEAAGRKGERRERCEAESHAPMLAARNPTQ